MKHLLFVICVTAATLMLTGLASAQSTGDFRSHDTGGWGNFATWEQYDGSNWITPAPALPDTLHVTTIRTGDTVTVSGGRYFVGNSTIQPSARVVVRGITDTTVGLTIVNGMMTVQGTLCQTDTASASGPWAIQLEGSGALTIANGGTFQQDQNAGHIPTATWDDGSTFLVTGVTTNTNPGSNARQNWYSLVWNCPNQSANANFGFNPTAGTDTSVTIRGDITILNTGLSRAYLTGPPAGTAGAHTIVRITINGKITVLNGAIFSSNGTSSNYTDIYVTTLGNILVRDSVFLPSSIWQFSQLAISRGSQGTTGTTTWYIKSDSMVYGRKTTNQNSTDANTGATNKGKFIFCKPGTQVVRLDDSVAWSGECNMQFGDSTSFTTIDIGNSPFGGSACTQRIKLNATVITGPNGYIGGGTNTNSFTSSFAMDSGATLVIGSENGIRATGMGSSGAVRVSGNRDYGTGSSFEYRGIANQRLGSGFPASAENLTINNSHGVYVDSVSAFTINAGLMVSSGDLDLNGCTITLGPSAALGETPGNTVKGSSGVLTTTRLLNAPSALVDIAGLGIMIGSEANLGSTVITRGHAAQSGNGHTGILRYYDIAPTLNTGLNASLVFRYDGSELAGQDSSLLSLWKSEDGGSTWSLQSSLNTPAQRKLSASGVGSLSRWSVSDAYNPLGPGGRVVTYQTGWNMISVPWSVSDSRKSQLFPFSQSRAFTFDGSYTTKESLSAGSGYWLRFPSPGESVIPGTDIAELTVNVRSGWNMVGSISVPIGVHDVTSPTPGMITSVFFGYDGAYVVSDTIWPGKGYWVRVASAGQLTFSGPGSAASRAGSRIRIDESMAGMPPAPPQEPDAVPAEPVAYRLSDAYPNPFNPSTHLEFQVANSGLVTLKVYDVLGREVTTLVNGVKAAGTYSVEWNAAKQPSGVYYYRLQAGSYVETKQLVLIR